MKYIFTCIFIFLASSGIYAEPWSSVNRHPSSVNRQPSTVNRTAFYKAMEENNKALVDSELLALQAAPVGLKQAFEGAMTMKKSGLGGSAPTKLHLFKEGRKMLSEAIKQDPNNVEFRFLRLMIQEHAPGILGYNKDMEADSEYIRKMYKSLPDEVQRAVLKYNKKSKVLKLDLS
jgi:hypothetical protein